MQATRSRQKKFGRISINDTVMYAALKALVDFPEFNAHFLDNRIIHYKNINLGFAVDTPRGLMVPVIKEANTLSLSELSAEAKRLASHCIDGTINPDDLTGGTFTITNLGSMGIESFTPVLNAPEVAILGVCAVQTKPILKGTEVEFIPHLGLSLTFDHCANDGAPAARFISNLRKNYQYRANAFRNPLLKERNRSMPKLQIIDPKKTLQKSEIYI